MSFKKHIIRQPTPYRRTLITLIAMIISSSAVWHYMQSAHKEQQQEFKQRQQLLESYSAQLRDKDKSLFALSRNNKELHAKTIKQQSAIEIQTITAKQLQLQQNKLQQEIATLKKDLLFYQSINQGNNSALQIRELHLNTTDIHDDIIRYRIVITQSKKINKAIKGSVSISLSSESNGKISERILGTHTLNLRHVQVLEGQLKLAQNTAPQSLTVVLTKSNKKTLSRTFDWQQNINN